MVGLPVPKEGCTGFQNKKDTETKHYIEHFAKDIIVMKDDKGGGVSVSFS